jgi:hypothetical protein
MRFLFKMESFSIYSPPVGSGSASNFAGTGQAAKKTSERKDPFDEAVANYAAKAAAQRPPEEPVSKQPSREPELLERIARLENLTERLLYGMENVTAVLECDEEGGGTITITFPEPP